MGLRMAPREVEAFLRGVHIGVLAVAAADEPPLCTPVWYQVGDESETLQFFTSTGSRKARLLRRAEAASLCVQDEAPPYQSVTVSGPATEIGPTSPEQRLSSATRYLGQELASAWFEATEGSDQVTFELGIASVSSVDYTKRF